MAYYKNWRKRHAEVRALAFEDSTSSEETCVIQRTQCSEDEVASLAPSADDLDEFMIVSDYYAEESSDTDSEFDNVNLRNDPAVETVPDLSEELAACATRNSFRRCAVNELLDMLRRQGHRLPKDARTLLQTPKKVASIEKCGGHYAYFGVASGVLKVLAQNPDFSENSIDICINIDGVPLFKSSSTQIWPILCSFNDFVPFIVAIFCGKAKPNSAEEYLFDFLQEFQHLQQDGIVLEGKTFQVSLKAFICDAPARAFLKCIKNHNSYCACERCTIKGTYVGRVVLGAEEPGVMARSETEFRRLGYKDHQVKKSPLILAEISCIQSFALDYMHLVCLGVVRRMLHFMKQGPAKCRLSFQQRNKISDHLKSLSGELPREFARQPRSLLELDRWKATELRQFLLYTGPVVLRRVISDDMYKHFLALTVSMSIMLNSDDQVRNGYIDYARELIICYVKMCKTTYGDTFSVYNVHSLIHLPEDVEHFNCSLNYVSSFPFENYLQTLKKFVRQSKNPIAQVAKRLTELEKSTTFKPVTKKMFTHISTTSRDGCFLLENRNFAFVKEKHQDGTLVCEVIHEHHTENLFESPCESKLLNIARVRDLSRARRQLITRNELYRKVVALPARQGYILFPMLHEVERR